MENITSVIVWGLCLIIGAPLLVIGTLHIMFPKGAWSVYRGWGKAWGSDPEEIAPQYDSKTAMRVVGFALGLGGVFICCIPKLMGH